MALRQTTTLRSGLELQNAIHRVREVKLQGSNFITFKLKCFASVDDGKALQQNEYGCPYNINKTNPIAQAYDYVRTLPEFENAIDC